MKKCKTFRLSERAIDVLEAQDNATNYIEGLIIGDTESKDWVTLVQLKAVLDERLAPLLKRRDTPSTVEELDSLPTGRACCRRLSPCVHWQFNDGVWANSLTGETKDESK